MNFKLQTWLQNFFLLPMILLWVLLMGLILKSWLAWFALILLYLLSTASVSGFLIRPLEQHSPLTLPLTTNDGVIVVLGGGLPGYSPEMPGYRPSPFTVERLRYGSWLQKQTGLPLLVSGGGFRPEAESMALSLENDFGAKATWLEDQSKTTRENAQYTRSLLPDAQTTVILVTHAWHMPRSVMSFEAYGFTVIPAPTAFHSPKIPWQSLIYWLPQARHLVTSELALREYIGYLWYLMVI